MGLGPKVGVSPKPAGQYGQSNPTQSKKPSKKVEQKSGAKKPIKKRGEKKNGSRAKSGGGGIKFNYCGAARFRRFLIFQNPKSYALVGKKMGLGPKVGGESKTGGPNPANQIRRGKKANQIRPIKSGGPKTAKQKRPNQKSQSKNVVRKKKWVSGQKWG